MSRYTNSRIVILENEDAVSLHWGGGNCCVLHSGIYHPSDSLKAKLCRQGAIDMADYRHWYRSTLNPCDKILLPTKNSNY